MTKFGDICSLLMATNTYTHWPLAKVYDCFGYPCMLDQCLLYRKSGSPVGIITFAYVSDDALEALLSGERVVQKHDWRSGKNLFVPDLLAPYGDVREMCEHFHKFVKKKHGVGFKAHWYRPALKRTGYAKTR